MEQKKIRYGYSLVILAAVSIAACITANIVSADLIHLPFLNSIPCIGSYISYFPAGCIFFPISYMVSDIFSEIFGYRISRWNAWLTLATSLIVTYLIIFVVKVIPHPVFVQDLNNSLSMVFCTSAWVIIGSIASALFGGWVNDIVFQKYRHNDGLEKFAKRKLLSSAFGEIVDTVCFICIAFGLPALLRIEGFNYTWKNILGMIFIQFVIKYGLEAILEPVTKKVVDKVRQYEGTEIFEDRNNFNIFGFYKKPVQ